MSSDNSLILFVEDNLAHAELTLLNFRDTSNNYNLKHISNGQEALDYFYNNKNFERPVFILLDLRLPKVDGFDVMKKLKSDPDFNDIPIIILSTSNASIDSSRAYEMGANSYLVKPLSFKDFQQLIEDVCKYWINWNIAPRD